MNIIFAVTENQSDTYKELIKLIEGSTTGILKNDSSNIVELVRAEYDKITSTLELKHDMKKSLTDYVKIKFYSKCLNNKTVETDSCSGLRVGTQVNFDVKIELLKCPGKFITLVISNRILIFILFPFAIELKRIQVNGIKPYVLDLLVYKTN